MELLLSAVVTILVQFVKWFSLKVGDEELGRAITLFMVFVFTFIGTIIMSIYQNNFDHTNIQDYIRVFLLSVGYYEIAIKRLIEPAFEKIKVKIKEFKTKDDV